MNRRLLMVLLIAFLIAGIATLVVYRLVGSRVAASKPVQTTRVVAATHDLSLGSLIAASDLTTMAVTGSPAKGALTDPKDVIGRGVTSQIYQGEPILESRLAPKGAGGGLAANIRPGMRAMAVKVDDVVGVAGFVTPGMRVDVLVSGTPPGENQSSGELSATVLQNIEVLSAGTDIQQDNQGKPKSVQVVNLLVTPDQAQKLSLASNQLKIQLVLRNPTDTKTAELPSTPTIALFPNMRGPAPSQSVRRPRPAAPTDYQVVVTNGTNTTVQKLPGGQQ